MSNMKTPNNQFDDNGRRCGQALPRTGNPIDLAAKRGATFAQRPQGDWLAICKRRGRPVPLVQFLAPTQAEAASMFLSYFHITKE